MLSRYDPPVLPPAEIFSRLHAAGPAVWGPLIALGKFGARRWATPYAQFRADLGLAASRNPMFEGGASPHGTLALFSALLGKQQRDWPANTVQAGFVFYDGEDDSLSPELEAFLRAGDPPIVFTLGTAAVLLVGTDAANRPTELPDGVAAFDYAPFSQLLPRAAAVVHQGGVGTTAQAMRSGRPMLVMPYGVDQPDNAERVRRLGIARVVSRKAYSAERAARELEMLLGTASYSERAQSVGERLRAENGAVVACDVLEGLLTS